MDVSSSFLTLKSKIPLDWMPIPSCPRCGLNFCLPCNSRITVNRMPYQIQCGHILCYECLGATRGSKVKCPICSHVMEIERALTIEEQFEPNYHIVGLIYCKNNYTRLATDKKIKRTEVNTQQRLDDLRRCIECNSKGASYFVAKRSALFCDNCIVSSKDIHVQDLRFFFQSPRFKCKLHRHNIMSKVCKTCPDIVLCPICAADHVGHEVVSIYQENFEHRGEVVETHKAVLRYCESNKDSLKQLNSHYVSEQERANFIYTQICNHFNAYHALLQKYENTMLQTAHNETIKAQTEMLKLMSVLHFAESNLNTALHVIERAIKEPPDFLVQHMIYKFDKLIQRLPFHATFSVQKQSNTPVHIQSLLGVDPLIDIRNVGVGFKSLFVNYKKEFNKMETPEMGSAFDVARRLSHKKKFHNFLDAQKNIFVPNENHEIKLQRVTVTFVEDPQCFYVLPVICQKKIKEWNEMLHKVINDPKTIVIGNVYFVKCPDGGDNIYRGRVNSLKDDIFTVFLIDYGRIVAINAEDIHEIPSNISLQLPYSIKCFLYGILPVKSSWCKESQALMHDILDGKQPYMKHHQNDSDESLGVELYIDDPLYGVSLADALVYLDVAKPQPNRHNYGFDNNLLSMLDNYCDKHIPHYRPVPEKIHTIKPLYIGNPFDFSVLVVSPDMTMNALHKWLDELTNVYSVSTKMVYLPKVEMYCMTEINKVWHRVKILKLNPLGYCEVFLLDHGSKHVVSWKYLRQIQQRHMSQTQFAVPCALADVQPKESSWTRDGCGAFTRLMSGSNMIMQVIRCYDNTCEVSVFVKRSNDDICVNGLLVAQKHATSTGGESLITTMEHCGLVLSDDEEDTVVVSLSVNKTSSNQAFQCDNINETVNEALPASAVNPKNKIKIINNKMANSPKNKMTGEPQNKTCTEKEDDQMSVHTEIVEMTIGDNTSKCVQPNFIEIIKSVSPSELYVIRVNNKNNFFVMQNLIQEWVLNREEDETDAITWNEGDFALVRTETRWKTKAEWYRCTVTKVFNENQLQVHLWDEGTYHICQANRLLKNSEYNSYQRMVSLCELAFLSPPGGKSEWGLTSLEQLDMLLKRFSKFHASILKNDGKTNVKKEGGTVYSVVIWGCTEDTLNTSSPWVNINRLLVEHGVAHLNGKLPNLNIRDNSYIPIDKVCKKAAALEGKSPESVRNIACQDVPQLDGDWLPAVPIASSIFPAIPTYVDDDGIIYLRQKGPVDEFNEVESAINETFFNSTHDPSHVYVKREACIAKFDMDQRFYRARVLNVRSNGIYRVRFVDYGNYSDVTTQDLRRGTFMARIPIQSHRFVLAGVRPKLPAKSWPPEVIDFIHANIVGKTCQIRVKQPLDKMEAIAVSNLPQIEIDVDGLDVADLIIQHQLADKKGNADVESEIRGIIVAETKKGKMGNAEIVSQMFRTLQIEKNIKAYSLAKVGATNGVNVEEEEDTLLDTSVHPQFVQYEKDTIIYDSSSSSSISFAPSLNNASTHVPLSEIYSIGSLFKCTVTHCITPVDLAVYPLVREHQNYCNRLAEEIKKHPHIPLALSDIKIGRKCLALFCEDGHYYRATINNFDRESNIITTTYTDFDTEVKMVMPMFRKSSPKIDAFPLRFTPMRLYGLEANAYVHNEDEAKIKLANVFDNRTCFAFIREASDGNYRISMYEDETRQRLVYQSLIDDNTYSEVDK